MPDNTRRLVTIQDAAQYVGCHPATIRRRINDSALTCHRLGPRIVRVDLDEIDAKMGVGQPESGAA